MNQFNNISGGINNGISNNQLNPTNVNGSNNNNINSNGSSGNNGNGNNNGQMGGNGVNSAMAFGNTNTGMSSNQNMSINNSSGNASMPKQVTPQQLLQWLMNLDRSSKKKCSSSKKCSDKAFLGAVRTTQKSSNAADGGEPENCRPHELASNAEPVACGHE